MEELSTAIGVSRPTLSRYFHEPDSVRASTRQRIEDGLARVDYVPNYFATNLNRKSTRMIGVIVPHLNDLFFTSLIAEIETCAAHNRYTVIIQNSHASLELEARAARNLMSMSADGVIIAPLGGAGERAEIARLRQKIPVVFVDSRIPGEFEDVEFIGTNNHQSISLIVDYLCRKGSPPVFLGMPPLNSNHVERENAYRARMAELDLEPRVIPTLDTPPSWDFEAYAFTVMDQHFSRGTFTHDTVLCTSDRHAIGVLRAAHRHHLLDAAGTRARDRRFRVAGHDDYPLGAYVNPGLTTVTQNVAGIGRAAVERLLHHIQNPGSRVDGSFTRLFDAELKIRESA